MSMAYCDNTCEYTKWFHVKNKNSLKSSLFIVTSFNHFFTPQNSSLQFTKVTPTYWAKAIYHLKSHSQETLGQEKLAMVWVKIMLQVTGIEGSVTWED